VGSVGSCRAAVFDGASLEAIFESSPVVDLARTGGLAMSCAPSSLPSWTS
jgi:hypothetical protein